MSNEKSMKDYENELERSFQVLREGDILDVTVIGISDTEVTVDLITTPRALSQSRNAAMIRPSPSKKIW